MTDLSFAFGTNDDRRVLTGINERHRADVCVAMIFSEAEDLVNATVSMQGFLCFVPWDTRLVVA